MEKSELIKKVAEDLHKEEKDVDIVLKAIIGECVNTFKSGESINLGNDFGRLVVKKRVPHSNENSPKKGKKEHYIVVFKEGNDLKRNLKLSL